MAVSRQTISLRKSPRRRFGESGDFGAVPKFDDTEDNWQRFESALGEKLSGVIRDELNAIIRDYLYWSTAAKSAPFADDVERAWEEVREAALELKKKLANMNSPAASIAKTRLRTRFKKWRSHESDAINKVESILGDIAYCCKTEISASQSRNESFDEFHEWDKFIARMIFLFEQKGFPTSISSGPKISKFVAFVSEIQSVFPADVTKRGEHSPAALAKAMQRARDADRDKRRQAGQAKRSKKTEAAD